MPAEGIRVVDATIALAWVGDTNQAKLSRDARDAARATAEHDRVIGSAIAQGVTPVPASLADPYDDDASMLSDLSRRERDIELAFEMIAGKVEMTTIIALYDVAPADDAPGRGTAYLEQIRSAPARAASIADRIANSQHAEFGEPRRRGERGRVALSHLIPRDRVDRYRTLTLAHSGSGYRIVVDGPRAPYSFALLSPHRGTILAT